MNCLISHGNYLELFFDKFRSCVTVFLSVIELE